MFFHKNGDFHSVEEDGAPPFIPEISGLPPLLLERVDGPVDKASIRRLDLISLLSIKLCNAMTHRIMADMYIANIMSFDLTRETQITNSMLISYLKVHVLRYRRSCLAAD